MQSLPASGAFPPLDAAAVDELLEVLVVGAFPDIIVVETEAAGGAALPETIVVIAGEVIKTVELAVGEVVTALLVIVLTTTVVDAELIAFAVVVLEAAGWAVILISAVFVSLPEVVLLYWRWLFSGSPVRF